MDRAKANNEMRETLERRWPQPPIPRPVGERTLFLVLAHDPRKGASTSVLITAATKDNAERSVREHLGNCWANVYGVPICRTTDEVFRQL